MISKLSEINQYKEMLYNLTLYDLRTRYKGSILGFLWTFLSPLLMLMVYYVVFSVVLKVDIDHYFIYIFVGLLPWLNFQSTMVQGASSIVGNSNLIKKIYFPREIIPVSIVMSGFVNYFFGFIILLPFLFRMSLDWWNVLVWFPFILAIQFLVTLGLVFILSALTVFFRDVVHIFTIVLSAWFYFTPIMYPESYIPDDYLYLFNLNPLKSLISVYQNIFYYNRPPDIELVLWLLFLSIMVFAVGWKIFDALSKKFAEEI